MNNSQAREHYLRIRQPRKSGWGYEITYSSEGLPPGVWGSSRTHQTPASSPDEYRHSLSAGAESSTDIS